MSTDRDWEKFASQDAYWAVLTADEFKANNLNAANRKTFFDTGEQHVEYVLKTLKQVFGCPTELGTALDFGCGVGRLALPLARRSKKVIGVDVSPTMLRISRENAAAEKLKNTEFVQGDDTLSLVRDPLDFVHSVIVFQHIPPERGVRILQALLKRLRPGGSGYLHFTFASQMQNLPVEQGNTTGTFFQYYQRVGNQILRLGERDDVSSHVMQMNHYNLNELYCVFQQFGIVEMLTRQNSHGGVMGVEFFFRRAK